MLQLAAKVGLESLTSLQVSEALRGLWRLFPELGGWRSAEVSKGVRSTVKEVKSNQAGRITATFDPHQADKVQVVTYDSNDHKYPRTVELEVCPSSRLNFLPRGPPARGKFTRPAPRCSSQFSRRANRGPYD